MTWPAFLLALALTIPGAASAAALYKCATPGGTVTFQQAPCASGNSSHLEAGDSFGVRPHSPRSHIPAPSEVATAPDGPQDPEAVDHTPSGQPIYAGPRGGRYTLTASGRKNYLPRATADGNAAAPRDPPQQAEAAPEVHVGPRGGCYTIGRSGRKNYLPADRCPRD